MSLSMKKGEIYRLNCGAIVKCDYARRGNAAKYRVLDCPPGCIEKHLEKHPSLSHETAQTFYDCLSIDECWFVGGDGVFSSTPPDPFYSMSVKERIKP